MNHNVKLLILVGEISYIGNVHIDLDGLYGIRELGNRLRRPNCPAGIVLVRFGKSAPVTKRL